MAARKHLAEVLELYHGDLIDLYEPAKVPRSSYMEDLSILANISLIDIDENSTLTPPTISSNTISNSTEMTTVRKKNFFDYLSDYETLPSTNESEQEVVMSVKNLAANRASEYIQKEAKLDNVKSGAMKLQRSSTKAPSTDVSIETGRQKYTATTEPRVDNQPIGQIGAGDWTLAGKISTTTNTANRSPTYSSTGRARRICPTPEEARTSNTGKPRCYRCGKPGHLIRNCDTKPSWFQCGGERCLQRDCNMIHALTNTTGEDQRKLTRKPITENVDHTQVEESTSYDWGSSGDMTKFVAEKSGWEAVDTTQWEQIETQLMKSACEEMFRQQDEQAKKDNGPEWGNIYHNQNVQGQFCDKPRAYIRAQHQLGKTTITRDGTWAGYDSRRDGNWVEKTPGSWDVSYTSVARNPRREETVEVALYRRRKGFKGRKNWYDMTPQLKYL